MPEQQNIEWKEKWKDEYLKCAAILLFHPKPEKFITGAFIKIGYFETDDNLRFQNVIHGNLFEQIDMSDLEGNYITKTGKTGKGTSYTLKGQ